jgi:hypothetical protein
VFLKNVKGVLSIRVLAKGVGKMRLQRINGQSQIMAQEFGQSSEDGETLETPKWKGEKYQILD